jgi:branched-chain amino acid transport system substrate-binding protein
LPAASCFTGDFSSWLQGRASDCQALKTTGGNIDDAPAFLKAMHEVRLTHGPIGPVRLDEYGTPILDIHIRKVARVNGKLTNTIVKTYPQVSQFWTYDPKKFIEQPVFSRDFPPKRKSRMILCHF